MQLPIPFWGSHHLKVLDDEGNAIFSFHLPMIQTPNRISENGMKRKLHPRTGCKPRRPHLNPGYREMFEKKGFNAETL